MRSINEKHGVVDIVFLAEFHEKRVSDTIVCRRFKLCMEEFIRFWIDSSVQPVPFVVESDHSLINRNVIRILPIFGL